MTSGGKQGLLELIMAQWCCRLFFASVVTCRSHSSCTVLNGPLACKLKYVRNVGDVTSGSASATILCTENRGETGLLFVGCLPVPEPCSLPCVCEQSVKVLTLRMATKCANQP